MACGTKNFRGWEFEHVPGFQAGPGALSDFDRFVGSLEPEGTL